MLVSTISYTVLLTEFKSLTSLIGLPGENSECNSDKLRVIVIEKNQKMVPGSCFSDSKFSPL